MNKTEAIIISAAVALAMVSRFEAGVQDYVKTHRTEIQMAMNQLQGKPPIPFAAPEATPAIDNASPALVPTFELAMGKGFTTSDRAALQARVRAHLAAAKASHSAVRIELARLEPQLAGLRLLGVRNANTFPVYRVKTKKCPNPPATPGTPTLESLNIEAGSLP
jgi:hypothetical protein